MTTVVPSITPEGIALKLRRTLMIAQYFKSGWVKASWLSDSVHFEQQPGRKAWDRLVNEESEDLREDWHLVCLTVPPGLFPSDIMEPIVFRSHRGEGRYQWSANNDGTLGVWIWSYAHQRVITLQFQPTGTMEMVIENEAENFHVEAIVPLIKLFKEERR